MYIEKNEKFLNSGLFEEIPENDSEHKFNSLNYFAHKLWKKQEITQNQFDQVKHTGHRTPFAFFLPKIHKPKPFYNLKLRPIVSSVESFNYNLAKYLHKILYNHLKAINGKFLDSF